MKRLNLNAVFGAAAIVTTAGLWLVLSVVKDEYAAGLALFGGVGFWALFFALKAAVTRGLSRPNGAGRERAAGKRKPLFGGVKERARGIRAFFSECGGKVIASMSVMGLGQLLQKRWAKGAVYLIIQAGAAVFFVMRGAAMLAGLFTLGTVRGNAWYGVEGDNSVTMLIMGIFAVIVLIIYFALYAANVRDAFAAQKAIERGKEPPGIIQGLKNLIDAKFYKTALFIPIAGVCLFNVLPIIFMILVAFTNYGGAIVPPALVDWKGFESFAKILSLGEFAPTFVKILGWNVLWAVASTALGYFGGLGLALLFNKKCVKGKAFWRAFPILAYAVPGFISLLGFKFMFSAGGPINQMITKGGGATVLFLGLSSKWISRVIGLAVSAWISIPTSMLLATGILSNMNKDLYEAARIDGAGPLRQFVSLTLPFVLFATTPVLITSFIGNFNNFGIFFFLRGGFISEGYFLASDTDLLINWLYRLSIDNNYYSIGAAISLIIFIITSAVSLTVYVRSSSFKREDTYK
ncbi:MAG: sugar ABC transporter permease [Clostridiales bacterium]|jgi:arabinogalactan oligomer/maltooligosaccharide transport system permease protein|nr:sugar ABC transporter permease [Clostridiales bacterium]